MAVRSAELELRNEALSVILLPETGGGIARFDWHAASGPVPIMRPCSGEPSDPNELACYPLIPWSNRVTTGGFTYDGKRIELARNRADDAYPIHGTGWQRAWHVVTQDRDAAVLSLDDDIDGAYHYQARMAYRLTADTLHIDLAVTNTGDDALPFGLGLHPFFPRHGSVRLHAPARTVWRTDDRDSLIPIACGPVPPAWDFSSAPVLPSGGLNNGFQGWPGQARIHWPGQGLQLDIATDVDTYILYVPAGEAFFCFEPVDHPVNALNLPGGAAAHGMTVLAPGQALARSFAFRVSEEGKDR